MQGGNIRQIDKWTLEAHLPLHGWIVSVLVTANSSCLAVDCFAFLSYSLLFLCSLLHFDSPLLGSKVSSINATSCH